MGETSIAWTHYTFNPWWGCTEISPGCANCYARDLSKRYGFSLWGEGSPWRFFGDKHWREPLKWARLRAEGDPRYLVFVASMADVLEDARPLDEWRERTWALMEALPALTFLVLTKRPENAPRLFPARWLEPGCWPRNVVFGITTENQTFADQRVPLALDLKARTGCRILVSYEPALGPIDFNEKRDFLYPNRVAHPQWAKAGGVDQVIFGGESGHHARPCDLGWASATLQQCRDAGVAFFMKQTGSRPGFRYGPEQRVFSTGSEGTAMEARIAGGIYDIKGGKLDEWPEQLRVQERPW